MASTAMVQVLADTSRFDENLRSELTRIISRVEAQLPPITIQVRLDDDEARNALRRLTTTGPDPIRVRVDADTDKPLKNISNLIAKVSLIGPAVVQAGVASVGALAGLGSAFVTAGAAVGAFTAAVVPQMHDVTDVTKLYEDAQKAAADGAEDAADKQEEYNKALQKLQPATRDTAKSFIGLKGDFKSWSDSLSSSTMPTFTKGLELLRSILPDLTPLVKIASKQFGEFIDKMQQSVDNGGFAKFIDAVIKSATTTLPMLIRSFSNIIHGIIGIGKAFAPVTKGVTGGFENMTKSFRTWGEGLSSNTKFQEFLATFRTGSGDIGTTLRNLGTIIGNVITIIGPFTGILLKITAALSSMVAALPTSVLTALAAGFTAYAIALKLYAVYQAIATAAQLLFCTAADASRLCLIGLRIQLIALRIQQALIATWTGIVTAAQWAWNAALTANPIGIVIVAIAALVAGIIWLATKTQFFQTIWNATWSAVKTVAMFIWDWVINPIVKAFKWLWSTLVSVTKTIVNAVVTAWKFISSVTKSIWNGIKSAISTVVGAIKSVLSGTWSAIKSIASTAWHAIKNTIVSIFKGVWTGIKATISFIVGGVRGIKNKVTGFFSGAGRWLWNAGKAIIRGLINGIKAMASAAYNAVSGIVSKVRNLLPFSPAKEGPFSGKGYTTYSGKALMQGFIDGIQSAAPMVTSGMNKVLSSLPSFTPTVSASMGPMSMQDQAMRFARGDFSGGRNLNLRGDSTANVTVMIGNRVVDQYVEAKISKNNQQRDRQTYQGVRR